MTRAVRVVGAVLAVLAAAAVLLAAWRYLEVDALLDGTGPGFRLPQLVVTAVAGGAVVVCAAAVRAARSARPSRLLLTGPLLLAVLALEAGTAQEELVYDGSYVPLKGVTMTQAYGSELTLDLDGPLPRDAALLALALVTGALTAAAALRRGPAPS